MTPRFDTSKLGTTSPYKGLVPSSDTRSGRMQQILDAYMERTKDIGFVLHMLRLVVDESNIERTVDKGMRLLIFTQWLTAKEGGLHIARHVSMSHNVGHTPDEWYLWMLQLFDSDSLKLDAATDMLSWRISELNVEGIQHFENKVAVDQSREPIDLFSPTYVRKIQLGNPNPAKQDVYDNLMRNIHDQYREFYTYGTPTNAPEEFFI